MHDRIFIYLWYFENLTRDHTSVNEIHPSGKCHSNVTLIRIEGKDGGGETFFTFFPENSKEQLILIYIIVVSTIYIYTYI